MKRAGPRDSPAWRQALLLMPALIVWIIFCYRETAVAMVGTWTRSDTYAHAFVVPLISLWLIWRQRHQVLSESPRGWPLLVTPVIFASFIWLLGELTAVNALTQFALVATLVLAIMALLGPQISKRLAFPLAFLFFTVPIGDFMMPKLMEWTAAFAVLALRASGIPVYQEGLQFIIPSGNWSVVEACSGIRYIIASVTVGTLFAYLSYVSLRRRLIFIAASCLVPIIANWLRAYMIVMLGHFSGNKLAVGVDHLIYGWVFFGLVIMVMFMIGARWSEDSATSPVAIAPPGSAPAASGPVIWLVALGIALLVAAGPLAFSTLSKADQALPPRLDHLATPDGWSEATSSAGWQPAYAHPAAELHNTYSRDGKTVGLYIGYYRNQDYRHKLITSTNTLAVSNDPVWSVIARNREAVAIHGLPTHIRSARLLGKSANHETRLTVWQWYWINGKLTDSDVEAKFHTALSRLRGRGDDSAVIMLYASEEEAVETLPAFAGASIPKINQLLATTRDTR